jgi:phospholipid transport system substrate-binding protein
MCIGSSCPFSSSPSPDSKGFFALTKQGVRTMKWTIFFVITIFSLSFIIRENWQDTWGQDTGQAGMPVEHVRKMLQEVMTIQTDPQLRGQAFRGKRKVAIQNVIAKNFYFDEMVKQVLNPYWEKLDEAKREEFKGLFKDLFQDSYTKLVLDFLAREKILYTQEDIRGGQALVKTTIFRINEEIPIDYFLTPVEQRWLVHDVKIDGVSIVQNYQKSFARVIKQESFEGLLGKMRLQQRAIEKSS